VQWQGRGHQRRTQAVLGTGRVWKPKNANAALWQINTGAIHIFAVSDTTMEAMGLDDYKVLLYRNDPEGWVAEIPAIPGCHVLMATREAALQELEAVFQIISEEYAERNQDLPSDTTRIVHA
jgi:predicted RNase H-like HicB family nuclease